MLSKLLSHSTMFINYPQTTSNSIRCVPRIHWAIRHTKTENENNKITTTKHCQRCKFMIYSCISLAFMQPQTNYISWKAENAKSISKWIWNSNVDSKTSKRYSIHNSHRFHPFQGFFPCNSINFRWIIKNSMPKNIVAKIKK